MEMWSVNGTGNHDDGPHGKNWVNQQIWKLEGMELMNRFPLTETYLTLRESVTASVGKATPCERCAGDGPNKAVLAGPCRRGWHAELLHILPAGWGGRAPAWGLSTLNCFISPPKAGHVNPVCP